MTRRFYERASANPERGVHLDARALKTPAGALFIAPTPQLTEAIAAEWDAQGEDIVPSSMPLTQFAFAAIDHTPNRRDDLVAHVGKYVETDLLCHRVDAPDTLVAAQTASWDPILDWAARDFGLKPPVVRGVIRAAADSAAIAVARAVAQRQDDFRLTVLAHATEVAGSAVIALALVHGRLSAEDAFAAAALDDLWSLQHWGEDAEARARLDSQRAEFDNVARFIALLT